jgi:hypothetical protein
MSSNVYNICRPQGAVYVLLACINIFRLIPALLDLAAPSDMRLPLFLEHERPNDTVIIYLPQVVEKLIYDAEAFFHGVGTDFIHIVVCVSVLNVCVFSRRKVFTTSCIILHRKLTRRPKAPDS